MGLDDIRYWLIQQQCNMEFLVKDIKDGVDYLTRDRKIEAEKRGYVEGAKICQSIVQSMEEEYRDIVKLFSLNTEQYKEKLDELTDKMCSLQEKRDSLKGELYKRYYSNLSQANIGSGKMPDIWENDYFEDEDFYNDFWSKPIQIQVLPLHEWIMKLFTSKKEKAWVEGYSKAKCDCLEKIRDMQAEYQTNKLELFKDENEYLKLIDDCLKQITVLSVQIIQLMSVSE